MNENGGTGLDFSGWLRVEYLLEIELGALQDFVLVAALF